MTPEQIGQLPINPTAKYIGTLMHTLKVYAADKLAAIAGLNLRTVQRAKADFQIAAGDAANVDYSSLTENVTSVASVVSENEKRHQCRDGRDGRVTSVATDASNMTFSAISDSPRADIDSRASKESPSEIVISKKDSPLAPQGAKPPSSKTNLQPRERGSRLSRDWTLPDDCRQWALTNCFVTNDAISREADKFRDHWISKPGAQASKLDWTATWRNWCRTAFSEHGKFSGQRKPQTTYQQPKSVGYVNDTLGNAELMASAKAASDKLIADALARSRV